MKTNILNIKNLSAGYYTDGKYKKVLNEVNINVNKGETVAVVGESGCGKSTLAMAIMGLISKKEGIIESGILQFNEDTKNLLLKPQAELLNMRGKHISLIMQDPYNSLNPVLRIGKQMEEVFFVHRSEADKATAQRNIKERLEQVHLNDIDKIVNAYPHELSGGMLQRVNMAIALMHMPQLLIADEPTSSLDVTIQKLIIKNLQEIKKDIDLSMIFISHDLNLVSNIADRIYVMYDGVILESAPSKKIFLEPQHPYTKDVLKVLPSVSAAKDEFFKVIKKKPSNRIVHEFKCPYFSMCEKSSKDCMSTRPSLKQISKDHYVRCLCL